MRTGGFKTFGISFLLSLMVLLPLLGGAVVVAQGQNRHALSQAAESQSGVAVARPDEENVFSVLLCVADDPAAFVLVYLDAENEAFRLMALPAQGVLLNGMETPTLAESYAAAGPARVAELLNSTLSVSINRYLAISPDTLAEVLAPVGSASAGLSGCLTAGQLAACGTSGAAQDWDVPTAHAFLARLALLAETNPDFSPETEGLARAALWQAWARQKLPLLPAALPSALRAQSGKLLTNLSATDWFALSDTLSFLQSAGAEVSASALPGSWNAATLRYEFDDDTLTALNAFFGVEAGGGSALSGRAA